MVIALIVYWIAGAVFSYYLDRRQHRTYTFLKWDNFARATSLLTAILFGTYWWLLILVLGGIMKIADSSWAKREAKW